MVITQLIGEPILNNFFEGFLFTVFAFFIGIISSSLGVGGGFITTPSLIILGINEAFAVGTVLFMIIFTAISSTIAYSRQVNMIQYRTGLLVATTSVFGAVLGSFASSYFAVESPALFRLVFTICLIPIAIKMILYPKQRKKGTDSRSEEEIEHDEIVWFGFEKRELWCLLFGFVAGFSSGLLGIGGGVVMVPILVHLGKIPMHKAVATSMFIMIFTSTAGAVIKVGMGQVHPDLAIFLILGIILGAQIGPLIVQRIDTVSLQKIFGGMMIIALISIAVGREQVIGFIQSFLLLFK